MSRRPGPPAIVLGGHTSGLAVVRALGESGISVGLLCRPHDFAQSSKYLWFAAGVPNPVGDEAAFVDRLSTMMRRHPGAVVVPTSDDTLVALARHKSALSEDGVIGCPDWDVVERVVDKTKTYRLASLAGLPCPRTVCLDLSSDLLVSARKIGFPLLLKPAVSHTFYQRFGRKMVVARNPGELLEAHRVASGATLPVMLQEIIPGEDTCLVNYIAYWSQGKPVAEFTSRLIRAAPPGFGMPLVVRSERIPSVIEPGRTAMAAVGFDGFANVEFKWDARDGTLRLLDINGRYNQSGLLALRAGINFALLEYEHLAKGRLDPVRSSFCEQMYWTDVGRDIVNCVRYQRCTQMTVRAFARPYGQTHCDAVFDRVDPGPGMTMLAWYGVGAAKRLVTRTLPRHGPWLLNSSKAARPGDPSLGRRATNSPRGD